MMILKIVFLLVHLDTLIKHLHPNLWMFEEVFLLGFFEFPPQGRYMKNNALNEIVFNFLFRAIIVSPLK